MLHCAVSFYKDPVSQNMVPMAKIKSKRSGKILGWMFSSEIKHLSIIHEHTHVETNIQLVSNQTLSTNLNSPPKITDPILKLIEINESF